MYFLEKGEKIAKWKLLKLAGLSNKKCLTDRVNIEIDFIINSVMTENESRRFL